VWGKGMRIVRDQSEIKSAFRGARSEAKSAFGDDRIYLEKYISRPRHIEIQIIADNHEIVFTSANGNVLFRDGTKRLSKKLPASCYS